QRHQGAGAKASGTGAAILRGGGRRRIGAARGGAGAGLVRLRSRRRRHGANHRPEWASSPAFLYRRTSVSNRILAIAVMAAALLAAIGGFAAWRSGLFGPHEAPSLVGGPFQLVDQDGRRVDQTILKGKWTAVFFGYTYCPEA